MRLWSTLIRQPVEPHREKFHDGIILFNSGEFFKAHEIWEEIWLDAAEPERIFFQGLIQLAAAFHHYSRGNRSGAQSLIATALAKLETFPGDYSGVNLTALCQSTRAFLDTPRNRPACVPLPAPTIHYL